MRSTVRIGLALAASVSLASGNAAFAQPDLINTQIAVSGLSAPLAAVWAPGDASVMYVVERGGRVRVVVNGQIQAQAFIDLSPVLPPSGGTITFGGTTYTYSRSGEQGLLGLAFAPDYATSGVLYVNLTARRHQTVPNPPSSTDYSWGCPQGNCQISDLGRTVVAKFQRDPNNPLLTTTPVILDVAQLDAILTIDQPFTNHNGGNMIFGHDGMLYIGTGDGGSGNDPGNRAQNTNDLLGKMLRIDPSGDDFPADAARDYRIPAGNPFIGGGGRAEIWAVGVRNPWRWSFDRATGDLWIADVGQNLWEEVNVVPGNGGPGRNYGWRPREGLVNTGLGTVPPGVTDPVHVYGHGSGATQGFSITGGYVYRGSAIPHIRGRYFFADYVNQRLWSGRLVNGVYVDHQSNYAHANNIAASALGSIASFAEDPTGEMYIVQLNGVVKKIVPGDNPPCRADIDNGSSVGWPDGGVNIDDLLFFLALYEAGDLRADQDNGSGTGVFDNGVTIDDLLYYLTRFEAGC